MLLVKEMFFVIYQLQINRLEAAVAEPKRVVSLAAHATHAANAVTHHIPPSPPPRIIIVV
jgi:hypothetical protein